MNAYVSRRQVLMLAATATGQGIAFAQQSPKVVRLIVPFPAGGTADVLPRIVAANMRAAYPNGIIVENKSGAGGNIGAAEVARAETDGTTFLVSPPGPIAINHHLYPKLPFDPTRWVPVSVLATVPNVLAVRKGFPAESVAEFIAHLKANSGKVTFASQGNGSTSHLTAAMFMQLTGTEMVHLPYKGTAPALVDLVAGNIDVFFDNISSSAHFHTSGKLKVLAVADEQRSPALPQVPTFAEQMLPAMNAVTFFTVVAPPGTSVEVAGTMQRAISGALAQPDVRQKFQEQGAIARGWTPEETGRFIRAESQKWSRVIKMAKVTVE